eukprot:gene966-biopygen2494
MTGLFNVQDRVETTRGLFPTTRDVPPMSDVGPGARHSPGARHPAEPGTRHFSPGSSPAPGIWCPAPAPRARSPALCGSRVTPASPACDPYWGHGKAQWMYGAPSIPAGPQQAPLVTPIGATTTPSGSPMILSVSHPAPGARRPAEPRHPALCIRQFPGARHSALGARRPAPGTSTRHPALGP